MNKMIKNQKVSEVLAEKIMQLNYGDVVQHRDIERITGYSYNGKQYNSIVQSAKKIIIRQSGKMLESIRGVGYRVVMPDNYVDHSLKHYKRGFKEFEKGFSTLNHAPINEMSEEGRTTYRRVNDRATLLNASMKGAMVELKTLGKKNHPFLPENMKR